MTNTQPQIKEEAVQPSTEAESNKEAIKAPEAANTSEPKEASQK